MSERIDIAILGAGPAGMEAAVTATVRNKKIVLFGHGGPSEKVMKAHAVLNYLGLPNIAGGELAKRFREHLGQMDIGIDERRVTAVYAMGDYYSLQVGQDFVEASSVILATGVSFGRPLPGENEFLGNGVSYCATCDAPLYKGKTALIAAYSKEEESEAVFMAEVAGQVLLLPQYANVGEMPANVKVLPGEKPLRIEGEGRAQRLVTDKGSYEADGIFLLRESVSPAQLVPGLALDGVHVAVNRRLETNLPGLFAAGDITGTPYQYIKSAGEGNVAALSAVSYLDAHRKR